VTDNLIQQFRDAVYQNLHKRHDAIMDLIDALTVAGHVESPVALSEATPFRRKFSMVYDALCEGELDLDELPGTLLTSQPGDSATMAGYEVYGLDTTPNERPEAETLPERCSLKSQKDEPVRYGHKYSWLVRLLQWGSSWVAPQDVLRVDPQLSDNQVGGIQVQELALRDPKPKVVVEDSLYGNVVFLAVFLLLKNTFALVRLRSNLIFYEQPQAAQPGKKGAPCKHGPRFKLSSPPRLPDRTESFKLGSQTVHLQAWHGLHFKKLSALVGMLLRVEFLKADGQPRYKRPLWLFWTGPLSVSLQDLCKMYLWRFAIEHMFRFLKQHLGLNASRSNNLVCTEQWMWLCALAYWQLLLMRKDVADTRPAWQPRFRNGQPKELTPRQVQMAALPYLLLLGTPAQSPKVTGKGTGRSKGYQPKPRTRFPVVKKATPAQNLATASP
jgi:hypothetical protein